MSVCIVSVELTLDGAEDAPDAAAIEAALERDLAGLSLAEPGGRRHHRRRPAAGVIIDDVRVHTIGPVNA